MTAMPYILTAQLHTYGAELGVIGPADALARAFAADEPITLDGRYAGEVVYLGHVRATYEDGAAGRERVGLDRPPFEAPNFPGVLTAVYLVDERRLEGGPELARLYDDIMRRRRADAYAAEARARADDERLDRLDEDGA